MKVWAIRIGIALIFNAITLWVASVLPGIRLGGGFLGAVAIFTAATLLIKPLITSFLTRRGEGLGSRATWLRGKALTVIVGLLATLGILMLTGIFSSGFNISGLTGWVLATVVIWAASLVYDFVDDGLEARARKLIDGISSRSGKQ
ncbi:hypothetical protein [Pseudarthrobacter sp. N5]|uniref:hypothetical protein n=1 Tax=Pseudarthrobacter sp. N5 TaxID=3418416 RepID=UPI003CF450D3